jgi:DNA-binding PadR family transcriptional regulator
MEWIYGPALVVVALVALWRFIAGRPAEMEKYVYLDVLDSETWKSGRAIKKEVEALKRGRWGSWLSYAEVYAALDQLQSEGLIESRFVVPHNSDIRGPYRATEYRLTASGVDCIRQVDCS